MTRACSGRHTGLAGGTAQVQGKDTSGGLPGTSSSRRWEPSPCGANPDLGGSASTTPWKASPACLVFHKLIAQKITYRPENEAKQTG